LGQRRGWQRFLFAQGAHAMGMHLRCDGAEAASRRQRRTRWRVNNHEAHARRGIAPNRITALESTSLKRVYMTHRGRRTFEQLLGHWTGPCTAFGDVATRRTSVNNLFWTGEWRGPIVELVVEVRYAETGEGGSVAADVGVGLCGGLRRADSKLWRWKWCEAVKGYARGVGGREGGQSEGSRGSVLGRLAFRARRGVCVEGKGRAAGDFFGGSEEGLRRGGEKDGCVCVFWGDWARVEGGIWEEVLGGLSAERGRSKHRGVVGCSWWSMH
jgi:hypothetical protein